MGRLKTPNVILEKRGSKKSRPDEPQARAGEIVPTLDLGPEALAAWNRICAELKSIGVLSASYADFITIAADAIGDIHIASADLRERGQISITERGETKNPSFTIKTSAQATAYKYLTSLGLTPTAIGKLADTVRDEINEFDDL